jgi:hypothetical protein
MTGHQNTSSGRARHPVAGALPDRPNRYVPQRTVPLSNDASTVALAISLIRHGLEQPPRGTPLAFGRCGSEPPLSIRKEHSMSVRAKFARATLIHPALAGSLILLSACSDASAPTAGGRTLSFALATRPATTASAAATLSASSTALAGSETIALGNDTIIVTSAQLVLRKIELERVSSTTGCSGSESDQSSSNDVADDCESVRTGPILVDLPLGGGAARAFTATLDTGTYKKFEVKVHSPDSGDAADAGFLQTNPDFNHVSIRVSGTFNHAPFTFTTSLDAEQETELVPPVAVTDATPASLTLMVDLNGWFLNEARSALVSPASAMPGQPNQSIVENNIKSSFHAFEDENEHGQEDH